MGTDIGTCDDHAWTQLKMVIDAKMNEREGNGSSTTAYDTSDG